MKNVKDQAARILFFLVLGYVLLPAPIIVPLENDEIRIALGAARHGASGQRDMDYRYDVQPGAYLLAEWVARGLGLGTHEALSWISIVSVVVFLLSSSLVVGRWLGVDFGVVGLAAFLFPESFTAAYYGSSSAPSAACLWLALLTFGESRARALGAGAVMGLAVWFRADALLLAPALWLLPGATRRRSVEATLALVASTVFAFVASGASFFKVVGDYESHAAAPIEGITIVSQLIATSTLGGAALACVGAVGMVRVSAHRRVMLAAIPTVLAYLPNLASPKYLLAVLPFLSALAVLGGLSVIRAHSSERTQPASPRKQRRRAPSANVSDEKASRARHRWALPLVGVLLFAQYLIPAPSALGPEPRVRTADGPRPFLALAAAPVAWLDQKRRLQRDEAAAIARLLAVASRPGGLVTVAGIRSAELVPYRLISAGFELTSNQSLRNHRELRFVRGSANVVVAIFSPTREGLEEYQRGRAGIFVSD
ncbi:MAG: hypothetical protein HYV07_10875 [Deltaproteobacteria bacterium]|nr:hypothetical protein [Deltaproteobacteria bacterium]